MFRDENDELTCYTRSYELIREGAGQDMRCVSGYTRCVATWHTYRSTDCWHAIGCPPLTLALFSHFKNTKAQWQKLGPAGCQRFAKAAESRLLSMRSWIMAAHTEEPLQGTAVQHRAAV
jgi:hypothetical protein